MSHRDPPAEDLDEARPDDEYPPERPLAADDQGITSLEHLGGESVDDRDERTEPEVWRRRRDPGHRGRSIVVEEGARPSDQDIEGTLSVEEETSTGPLAPDDEISGDETTRDVSLERDPEPAEEATVHDEQGRGPE